MEKPITPPLGILSRPPPRGGHPSPLEPVLFLLDGFPSFRSWGQLPLAEDTTRTSLRIPAFHAILTDRVPGLAHLTSRGGTPESSKSGWDLSINVGNAGDVGDVSNFSRLVSSPL
jgi:hypothetical protein